MGQPSGEVIARPMVARACGCLREFQHYAVDKYRAQRLAKFQKTRCEVCVAKLNEDQKQAAANVPKKGEAFKQLPPGTQMTITCRADGTWTGTLTADGKTVQADGDGPQGVALALARVWLTGAATAPVVKPPPLAAPAAPAPRSAHPAPRPGPPRPK
ncbi:MAG: hypothetical protein FJ304_16920 [Planctomycetes bacterium]|nr:hypothetical protein [Planctomycetota bacterium]